MQDDDPNSDEAREQRAQAAWKIWCKVMEELDGESVYMIEDAMDSMAMAALSILLQLRDEEYCLDLFEYWLENHGVNFGVSVELLPRQLQ